MGSTKMELPSFVFTALTLLSTVQADIRCGIMDCQGSGAYCCLYDSDSCCFYYVYTYWWFWFIWGIGIIIFVSIVYGCCRARRRRNAGLIVHGAGPSVSLYGTTTCYTGPAGYVGQYPQQQYSQIPQAAPPAMPPTAPAYQEKPPAYAP